MYVTGASVLVYVVISAAGASVFVHVVISVTGASVLVHGSEGRDSTLQVTSLAQILLDPDCRTIRG